MSCSFVEVRKRLQFFSFGQEKQFFGGDRLSQERHCRMAASWVFLAEKFSFSDHVLGFLFLQARMRAAAKARQRSDAELGMEDFL